MDDAKTKVLVLVEGEKTDVNLMSHLFDVYGISNKHQIVSYNTNIYVLYNRMFKNTSPEDVDLLQVLKEQERDTEKKKIFDERYSDILLVFDLDPQDPLFSFDKIKSMVEYFVESSDMGKLYLNYPMVEAFYHMKEIPDPSFGDYRVTLDDLYHKRYKSKVKAESRNGDDYENFAINKEECNSVILQNIEKSWNIVEISKSGNDLMPSAIDILSAQLKSISDSKDLAVLCTCAFYIPDYNSKLLF